MTALSSYSTGTISVAGDGTAVVGVGTLWLTSGNAKPGDLFQSGHYCVFITDVTDDTDLVITPWPGATLSGAAYSIWKVSQQRIVGATAAADVDKLVSALNTSGFFVFVDIGATAPDPSLGDDGQYAFQPTTGKTWAKSAGVWTYLGVYKAFNLTGAYNNTTIYSYGDVQTTAGSSYVYINATPSAGNAAPNPTYWQLLASVGATGATGATGAPGTNGTNGAGYGGTSTTSLAIGTGSKAFTTQAGLAYTNGARVRASSNANTANWMEGLATYSGTTLTINADTIGGSGTFADWNFNVVGQPGTATGAVLYNGAQALTAAQQAQARSNIGLGAYKSRARNGLFNVWQRGTSITPASTGTFIYTADGWAVDYVGAVGTVSRVTNGRAGALSPYAMQIAGATGCTDVQVKQRFESYFSAALAGATVTIQAQITNNTGASITPQIAINRCTAQDNWAATSNELAFTPQTACPNGATTQIAYTTTLSSGASNGIEIIFDFGNNFSAAGKTIVLAEVDVQITPNLATGLQSSPPVIDIRSVSEETLICQRYYYRRQAQSSNDVLNIMAAFSSTQAWGMALDLPVPMRASPTVAVSSIGHLNLNGNACTAGSFDSSNQFEISTFNGLTATGLGASSGAAVILRFNTTSGYIEASAEL